MTTDHEATAKRLVRGWRAEDLQGLLPNALVALEVRVAAALAEASSQPRTLREERQEYADAMAERDAEIARLKAACNKYSEQETLDGDLRLRLIRFEEQAEIDTAVIAYLRAKLAGAESQRDYYDTERQLIMARELRLSDAHEQLRAECDAEIARLKAAIKDEHDEAEHYRLEASSVYLANENLQQEIARLKEQLNPRNCPKCESPSPRLHPAMQHEGEVQECNHPFHAVADRDRLNKEIADLRAKLAQKEYNPDKPFDYVPPDAEIARLERDWQEERQAVVELRAKLAEAQTDLALARSDARIRSDADLVRGLERAKGIVSTYGWNHGVSQIAGAIAAEIAKVGKPTTISLEQFAKDYPCLCAENYPGTTAYHGHDCQNEVVQEFVAQWQGREG